MNTRRADALAAAARAVVLLKGRSIDVAADQDSAALLEIEAVSDSDFSACDLAITFGGDGTLIRAAHLCSEVGTPILGVYYGRFGFVTQCLGEELGVCLSAFFDGTATYEPRMMLETTLIRNGGVVATIHSLNEMVVQRAATAQMLTFGVFVDGKKLTTYPADGVLLCTPTGSTAYNLSAGGPILEPGMEAMVLTAIAPHTLSARPLVLKASSEVVLQVSSDGEAILSADGQTKLHLLSGDEIRVTKSGRVTNLLCVDKDDFLEKLNRRLFWSQSIIGGAG